METWSIRLAVTLGLIQDDDMDGRPFTAPVILNLFQDPETILEAQFVI